MWFSNRNYIKPLTCLTNPFDVFHLNSLSNRNTYFNNHFQYGQFTLFELVSFPIIHLTFQQHVKASA